MSLNAAASVGCSLRPTLRPYIGRATEGHPYSAVEISKRCGWDAQKHPSAIGLRQSLDLIGAIRFLAQVRDFLFSDYQSQKLSLRFPNVISAPLPVIGF